MEIHEKDGVTNPTGEQLKKAIKVAAEDYDILNFQYMRKARAP